MSDRAVWTAPTIPAHRPATALEVVQLREGWQRLTATSRTALRRLRVDAATRMHPSTRATLRRHGLVDDLGCVTRAGALMVAHRPVLSLPSVLRGRRVVDVHLPEEAQA